MRIYSIILFLFCLVSFVDAQPNFYKTDFQSRIIVQVDKKVFDNFNIALGYRMRFVDNSIIYNRSALSTALTYKLGENFKLQGQYMFSFVKNFKKVKKYRNMFALALIANKEFKKHNLKYRLLIQYSNKQFVNEPTNDYWYFILRNRLTYEYEWSKMFAVQAAYEHFLPLNNPIYNSTLENRYMLGVTFNYSKKMKFGLIYMLQHQKDDLGWFDYDFSDNYAGQQSLINSMVLRVSYSI